jgi:hypothetical protein
VIKLIVQDIQSAVQTFSESNITVSNTKAVAAMKLALSVIADKSGYDLQVNSADYTANVWNTNVLPENNLGVSEVNIDDGENTIYLGYQVRGRDILFYDTGTYIIHYKALPTVPTAIDSTLEVHPIYFDALWEFALGYCRLSKWDGDDNFGMQLITDFRGIVNEKWDTLNKRKGPKQMMVQRHR